MKNSQNAPMFFTPSSAEVVNDDYDYVINSDTSAMLANQKYSYKRRQM